jgi:integrase
MASIHRDPRSLKGVWYCAYQLADGRRAFRSTGKRNKAEAQIICQAWQQAENEAAVGELTKDRVSEIFSETLRRIGAAPLERISIKAWLEDWLTTKQEKSEATRKAYSQAVQSFLAYLGAKGSHRRLESITETDIRGFVEHLKAQGRSAGTVNTVVRKHLSGPFEKARKLGKIKYNPIAATDPLKHEAAVKDTFTPEQVVRLVKAAQGTDWEGAILLAYGTGARLQDVANLRWNSLDLEAGIVTFRERKTGRQAVLGLHPDFVDWLAKANKPENLDAYFFAALAGKSGSGRNGLSKAFERVMKQAGVEGRVLRRGNEGKGRTVKSLSFHSFRHSAASSVFNQAALKEITRRVTNHAMTGVVDRYIHHDLEAIREATKLIPRLPTVADEQ